ncbi:MAG TPA: M67 family metallopeptidase [Acidiferrobacterales bacterium]|jgi:proteasome lid subunit RPN8/RPN11
MTAELVRLPRPLVNQLLGLAQHAPREEICGLIAGRDGHYLNAYPVSNIAGDRGHRFEMDPRGQIDALRAMRERDEELMAIYHSHPDAPALPSLTDIAQHEYPGLLYLIVSLDTEGVLEMRGFRIRDGAVQEIGVGI